MDLGTLFGARETGPGTPYGRRDGLIRLLRPLAAGLGIGALLLSAAACDDDEPSADELQEVEDVARGLVEASGAEIDFVLEHATDNIFATVFFSSRDECQAAADECIGEPLGVESVSSVAIDGDEATATVVTELGAFEMGLIREDGAWKGDTFQPASDEVADGAVTVDLSLVDFAFGFDRAQIPGDGDFAFHVTNDGKQTHEVVLVGIAEGQELEQAIEAVGNEEVPPVALKVYIRPGQELDMAFAEPLAPGRYALVCFFPDTDDPEFAAHIEKGMLAEFTVE